jgi:uncharacterized LabA/DUF88 family protein
MSTNLSNYLFIDGNYLRRAYEDAMRQIFPDADVNARNINFVGLKQMSQASKVFYYDSVDEDAADATERRAFLDSLNSLDGFHIREGTLSRDKKRQKQVDVALAVECLTHAFQKNVWHVTLLAGDLDFKPLVDALVHAGVHVHVMYEQRSAARRLYRAADVARPLNLRDFWGLSGDEFLKKYPAVNEAANDDNHMGTHLIKEGEWNGRPVQLWKRTDDGTFKIFAPRQAAFPPLRVTMFDRDRLEKYFDLAYGSVTWSTAPSDS